jgi:hypothetical protein
MGATGFNGNDLAIGNGTNALGIFQIKQQHCICFFN